jgi:hypothetical protein
LRICDTIIVVIVDRTAIEFRRRILMARVVFDLPSINNSCLTFSPRLLAGIRNSICYVFPIHLLQISKDLHYIPEERLAAECGPDRIWPSEYSVQLTKAVQQ